MMQFKVVVIQIVMNILIAIVMIKAFTIGVALEKEIWGWDFWFVTMVIGAIVSAAAYKFLRIAQEFIGFLLKASYVYSLTCGETSLLKCLSYVTVDFKETASVATINAVIRKLMKSLTDSIYASEEGPEFLQRFKKLTFVNNLANSPIVGVAKKLTFKTFDYADECVLSYCYAKDDAFLVECFNGLCIFIKNALKTSAIIGSLLVISVIVKVSIVASFVWYYFNNYSISVVSLVTAYIILMAILFIWDDSIFETLCCYSTVKSFMKEVDLEEQPDDQIKFGLESVIDISELKAVIKRFGGDFEERIDDNVEEGTSSGDPDGCDASEELDTSI